MSELSDARRDRVAALFASALEVDEPDREAFIDREAADDPLVGTEVRSLLNAHQRVGDTLEHAVAHAVRDLIPEPPDQFVGTRIGSYELVSLIGMGGMGTVYEGVRADDQYRKRVAIKLLRRNLESDLASRRFRYERQILANLSHANIATLLDGGVSFDGQPYFVMEYVDGSPITQWCNTRCATIRDRLQLFVQICAAVQHAHQHMVVHRDLKPGNILVTDDGVVKLLDFGIARLLREEEGSDQLPPTQGGARAFTPEYASPEQVRGLQAGAASDVYSLGIVLFELLAGQRPYDLRGKLLAEVEQVVCHDPVQKPSAAVTTAHAALLGVRSRNRASAVVAGDLDAIVLMALRKDPARRYGSIDRMADDVRAFLNGLPVRARPDSLAYRVGKLIRRRRLETVTAAVAVASLVGGIVATSAQSTQAQLERGRATAIKDFLVTMLGAADPGSLGRDATIRAVLDSAVIRADSLAARPDLEAEIRTVAGNTYLALGEYQAAERELTRAVTIQQRRGPAGRGEVGPSLARLSVAYENQGRYGAADSMLTRALAVLSGREPTSPARGAGYVEQRARLRVRMGDFPAARPLFREALAAFRSLRPANDSAVATALHNLALVESELGDNVAADTLFRLAIATAIRARGDDDPLVASSIGSHAVVLDRLGRYADADSAFLRVLDIRRRYLGPSHPDYAWTMFNYADQLVSKGRYAEGAHWARQVLALRHTTLNDAHMAVSTSMQVLGKALGGMDSLELAEQYLRESLALRRAALPAGHWLLASSESVLGEHLALRGEYEVAEGMLLASERKLVEARGDSTQPVLDARGRLFRLYTAWGKPREAAKWAGTPGGR